MSGYWQHGENDIAISEETRRAIQAWLQQHLSPEVLSPFGTPEQRAERRRRIEACIREALASGIEPSITPASITPELVRDVYGVTVGLGPLEELLNNPRVLSITVNAPDAVVYQTADGEEKRATRHFRDEADLWRVVDSIAVRSGRAPLSYEQPVLDILLLDPPMRIHANLFGLRGPFFAMRRGRERPFGMEYLAEQGVLSREMVGFLDEMLRIPVSMLIVGDPDSGKTTFMESLLERLVERFHTRLIVVEDSVELALHHPLVSRLALSHIPNAEQRGYDLGTLSWTALRGNAEVLAVGEIRRSVEAGHTLMATSSVRAVFCTVHGTTPSDGLDRLLMLTLGAFPQLPHEFVARRLAVSHPLVVQMQRMEQRIVRGIYGVYGWTTRGPDVRPLFEWDGQSWRRTDAPLPTRIVEMRRFSAVDVEARRQARRQGRQRARELAAAHNWRALAAHLEQFLREYPDLFEEFAPDFETALRAAGLWDRLERRIRAGKGDSSSPACRLIERTMV